MEGRAQEMYSWPVDPHSWPNHSLFITSPHFTLPHTGHILGNGTEVTWAYRTHQWYWEMMVLNDSNHRRGGAAPVDWPSAPPYCWVHFTLPSRHTIRCSCV